MSDPIETVERKRHSEEQFRRELQHQWPRRERRRHAHGFQVPAHVGRDQVGGAEDVETAAEHGAGDAVEDRQVPGDLWFVDGEVGGDGAVEALAGEDGGLLRGFGDGGCGDVAARRVWVVSESLEGLK